MNSLQRTIDALARSRNEAATPLLIAALETRDRHVFHGAIRALVARRAKAGHFAVIERWNTLSLEDRRRVDGNQGRMGGALREALLSANMQHFENACEIASESGEFDLAPTLITVAEKPDGPQARRATQLVVDMVDRLCRLEEGEDAGGYTRHPETIRRSVLESLERSVERFAQHRRVELVESFIILAGPASATLHELLSTPHHPCHEPVVGAFAASGSSATLAVLIGMLSEPDAPPVVRNTISRRADQPFVEALLTTAYDRENSALQRNLDRIKSLACLEQTDAMAVFSGQQQATAMWLAAQSGAPDEFKLDLAECLLRHGAKSARLAACDALAPIAGQRANALVLAALEDNDGDVKAAATRQLRQRHIPGVMARLIELLESEHPAVSLAARESLAEFCFDNFALSFETLDDDLRRANGKLVARVDQAAIPRLHEELQSRIRRRRLRAIELAAAMDLLPAVADALVERLADDDHMVRAAAAEALQQCTGADVRDALVHALADRSYAVQTAARASLKRLGAEPPLDLSTGAAQ